MYVLKNRKMLSNQGFEYFFSNIYHFQVLIILFIIDFPGNLDV